MLTQNVYSVGTATQTVVAPTNDFVTYVLKNLEPSIANKEYSRQGYTYNIHSTFTVARSTSVSFTVLTGSTGLQIQFYEIISSASDVKAELIEGATVTVGTATVPSYNINRNYADDAEAVFNNVVSFTGGTAVVAEYITASKAGGGGMATEKIITLKPNTRYVFRFTEQTGSADPVVFFEMGFTEKYNGYNAIWLGTVNNSFELRAGEEIKFNLLPLETINATSLIDSNKLAVMRQE